MTAFIFIFGQFQTVSNIISPNANEIIKAGQKSTYTTKAFEMC
jgi:hypothetical protein